MDDHFDLPPRRRSFREAERALIAAVRVALLPALGLPLAIALLAASVTGAGLGLPLACPLTAVALVVNVVCWLTVVRRWRRLPAKPGDDEQGWRRWWGEDSPLQPSGGPSGISFDWPKFEQQFWAHVQALERQRELVPA
jgi:hypothetical protein